MHLYTMAFDMKRVIVVISALAFLFSCAPQEEQQSIKVESISIDQSDMTLVEGESAMLTAKVLPEDAENKTIKWSSSDESKVMVASSGKAVAMAIGQAVVTAQAGEAKDFITITVVAKTIAVTGISINPTELTIKVGETGTLTPEITPQEATNKKVTWASSNNEVASVEDGIVAGIKPGSVTITATTEDGEHKADCVVTVKSNLAPSVTVGAENISAVSAILKGKANLESTAASDLKVGFQYSKSAGILPSNSTTVEASDADSDYNYSVGITSLEPNTKYYFRSFVRQNGQDSFGETMEFTTKVLSSILENKDASDIEATCAVLNAKLDLTDVQYNSLSYGFLWGDSESSIDTDLKGGEITGNAFSSTLTGLTHKTQYWFKAYVQLDGQSFYGEIRTFTTDVVHVESVSLDKLQYAFSAIGQTLTLIATVLPDEATDKSLSWYSDKEAIASVDQNGTVTANSSGTATITVITNDQSKKAECIVFVPELVVGIELDKTTLSLSEGESYSLTATITPDSATEKTVTWTSSDTSIATVDTDGRVTAVSKGMATITASANDSSGKSASCSVSVIRLVSSITLDKTGITMYRASSDVTETISAIVAPSSANDSSIEWASSNTSVATVSSLGVITGVCRGNATITATAKDGSGISASCEVEVKQYVTGIALNKSTSSLVVGEKDLLYLTSILPDNANDNTVTWTSSDVLVATVDTDGTVSAVSKGMAIITALANDGSGVSATCSVIVSSVCPEGAVDMGITTSEGYKLYWATCNLSDDGFVSSPEQYGDYYAWGEIEAKDGDYNWSTYKWCENGDFYSLTKYNTNSKYGIFDGKLVLEAEDDVACVKLGGNWRMPTNEDMTALLSTCTYTWTTHNGINGLLITATNGNSIFLPAADGKTAYYWTSSCCPSTNVLFPYEAWSTNIHYSLGAGMIKKYRCLGYSIRPVSE